MSVTCAPPRARNAASFAGEATSAATISGVAPADLATTSSASPFFAAATRMRPLVRSLALLMRSSLSAVPTMTPPSTVPSASRIGA